MDKPVHIKFNKVILCADGKACGVLVCADDCPACAYNQAIKECREWLEVCGLKVKSEPARNMDYLGTPVNRDRPQDTINYYPDYRKPHRYFPKEI